MNLFKRKKYVPIQIVTSKPAAEPSVPDGLWKKCPSCLKTVHVRETGQYKICPSCGNFFRLRAWERIQLIADSGSFTEINSTIESKNPMSYPGYEDKISALQEKTGLKDAIVTGVCEIDGNKTIICAMDAEFIMASMGSAVGEKITRAFEFGIEQSLPVIIFTASGGARMQEGIISLMQMAKCSAAAKRHSDAGLLYITVLTDPTTGGVSASFAMLGDIILAEPRATVGFAGRRVIEQTIKQSLPEDFQTSEFLLEHGYVDKIVERSDMRETIGNILKIHGGRFDA